MTVIKAKIWRKEELDEKCEGKSGKSKKQPNEKWVEEMEYNVGSDKDKWTAKQEKS